MLARLTAGKVRNLYLDTPDGERLGVWHVLPDNVYAQHIAERGFAGDVKLPQTVFDTALR